MTRVQNASAGMKKCPNFRAALWAKARVSADTWGDHQRTIGSTMLKVLPCEKSIVENIAIPPIQLNHNNPFVMRRSMRETGVSKSTRDSLLDLTSETSLELTMLY